MPKNKFPNSIRKYIRFIKAKIRREVLEPKKQEEQIAALIKRFIRNSIPVHAEAVVKKIVTEKIVKKSKEKLPVKSNKSDIKSNHDRLKK